MKLIASLVALLTLLGGRASTSIDVNNDGPDTDTDDTTMIQATVSGSGITSVTMNVGTSVWAFDDICFTH